MKKRNIVQKGVTFALTAAMVGSSFVSAFPVLAAEDDSKSIVALTTDGLTNPLGVDTLTPVFTWQMESGKTGASQSAYQITVMDMDGNTVWDSGVVESGESTNIKYNGEELQPKTEYQWKVAVTKLCLQVPHGLLYMLFRVQCGIYLHSFFLDFP